MKNKIGAVLLALVVLFSGLLFYCPKTYAATKPILPHYIIRGEDVTLLLKIGVLEGGCDGVDGIGHVMQVVLNRFESDEWPNTIEGVIFQEGQFPGTANKLASAEITPEAWAALDNVIFGDYLWNEGIYFESMDGIVWDDVHEYLFTYKGHDFYK